MDEKIVKDSQGLAKELVNGVKEFEELKVIDLNGRPYYSIIYLENGNKFEGYSSYDLKVISEYLKRYFGFAQPEKRTEERAETHARDLIDRQAAIEAIDRYYKDKRYITRSRTILSAICRDMKSTMDSLPSVQQEIIRCGQCKYAEVADKEDAQDGYTCQFHRGSIWFSGSYCSWGERREENE